MHGVVAFERYLEVSRGRYRQGASGFIYSLACVKEFFFSVVAASGARSVCEIGSQGGIFSQELRRLYDEGHIDRLTFVDPSPSATVASLADGGNCRVVAGLSLDVLGGLEPHDLYVVDGDHNYHTVSNELRLIFRNSDAVAVLHDVGWPCATRDMYYSPETVPAEARHPHTFEVVLDPARDGIASSGERSNGAYAVAIRDGGPANGVFPAVRDMAVELSLDLDAVPALLGVAVVRASSHPRTEAIRAAFPSADVDALLWRLEENRIANWIEKEKADDRLRSLETAVGLGCTIDEVRRILSEWRR